MVHKVVAETLAVAALFVFIFEELPGAVDGIPIWLWLLIIAVVIYAVGGRVEGENKRGGRK